MILCIIIIIITLILVVAYILVSTPASYSIYNRAIKKETIEAFFDAKLTTTDIVNMIERYYGEYKDNATYRASVDLELDEFFIYLFTNYTKHDFSWTLEQLGRLEIIIDSVFTPKYPMRIIRFPIIYSDSPDIECLVLDSIQSNSFDKKHYKQLVKNYQSFATHMERNTNDKTTLDKDLNLYLLS